MLTVHFLISVVEEGHSLDIDRTSSAVEVLELHKVYDNRVRALDGVTLRILPSEIFALLGPNGAGKTTLFKVLLGIISSTSGETSIYGLSPSNPESRSRIGFLPENHRFPDHLTGAQLIELSGEMHGMEKSAIASRIPELLQLVDLSRWSKTKIRKYSKGMMQRIGLAQAMISDPDILFLDEPTDGVDPVGKIEIRKILQNLRNQGKTIFINSHLLSEIEMAADRVAIMNGGRIARTGSVEELTSRKSQFEIEASFAAEDYAMPDGIGKILGAKDGRMSVELDEDDFINRIIDDIRAKGISIRSIKPIKISLEESFLETVQGDSGGDA